jgi:isopentenyldiphosphate isomerase
MVDELVDIFDENDNFVGQAMKSEAWAKGLWHRGARVLIYNKKGEIFTQLRSVTKELHPGKWDVGVAGHVGAGESYIDAALREAAEEVGLNLLKDDLEFVMADKLEKNLDRKIEKIITITYFARFDGHESEIMIQEEEVQSFRFMEPDELERERKEFPEKFMPHSEEYWSELISGVKKRFNGV